MSRIIFLSLIVVSTGCVYSNMEGGNDHLFVCKEPRTYGFDNPPSQLDMDAVFVADALCKPKCLASIGKRPGGTHILDDYFVLCDGE